MRFVLLAVLAFNISVWAGQPPLTIELRGLSIASPGHGDSMDGAQPFNNRLGTHVALMVIAPAGGLLSFNSDASKVSLFQDDKGKNLLVSTKKDAMKAGFNPFPQLSKDSKACMLEIESSELPTRGAAGVTVAGEAVLSVATQKQEFNVENVALKPGTKFKAGPLNFEIGKCGKPDFGGGDWPFEVEFEFKQSSASLAALKFVDASGVEIPSDAGGKSSVSFAGNVMSESASYRLKKPADTVKIIATFWMDMKDVAVPFNLKVGPGL